MVILLDEIEKAWYTKLYDKSTDTSVEMSIRCCHYRLACSDCVAFLPGVAL